MVARKTNNGARNKKLDTGVVFRIILEHKARKVKPKKVHCAAGQLVWLRVSESTSLYFVANTVKTGNKSSK